MNFAAKTPLALAISTVLAACGGGSGGGSAPPPAAGNPPPPAAASRSVQATGPVTNFGSVIVNGVRYNTDQATFRIDGQPATQANLRVGYVVTVKGDVDDDGRNGRADDVYYDDIVTGPVEAIDADGGSLVVLGQTVLVSPTTSFDDDYEPDGLASIAVGEFVEVSGMFDADGNIVASRIEDEDDDDYEVHGFVSNLDPAAFTFTLNALVVDYGAASLDDFPSGMIADGDYVEAKGDALGANGELIADEVERESILKRGDDDDDDDFDDDDLYEIEGFITRFVSVEDFDVAGQPVRTTPDTEFEDGSAADLALNVKVEVEGALDANGVLVAEEIEIESDERSSAIRIEAAVDSIDADTDSIVLLGIPVTVDIDTRLEDKSDDDEESPFNVGDISVGDFVEVRGSESPAGSGEVVAVRLEREDDDDDDDDGETELQGFVTSIAEPAFEILGVTIETDGNTEFEGRDDDLSAGAFFDQLEVGSLIKVQGFEVSDTTLVAREVEFETDDD